MANLLVLDGGAKGQRVPLVKTSTRIGRLDGNDIVLSDGSVSGEHCEITRDGDGFLLKDLGSTNGTMVNSKPVKEQRVFRNDVILVGEIPVMLEGEDVPPAPDAGKGGETGPVPRTTIVIHQNRKLEAPKEFTRKSNSNKIWATVIVLLIVIIAALFYKLFQG